jgi:vancomycin resistance protein VanJ
MYEVGTDSGCASPASVGRNLRRPTWAAWLYVLVLVGVWQTIRWAGDRWWLPTVMMFGPKWIYAVPLPLLVAWRIAVKTKRSVWLLLAFAAWLLLFPISGFCVPWRNVAAPQPPDLCVLTCNTGGGQCDAEKLTALIAQVRPDVVCLQECRAEIERIFAADWRVFREGDLIVATRDEAASHVVLRRETPSRSHRPICHVIQIQRGDRPFYLATVHLLSPRDGLAEITSARTILAPSQRRTLVRQTGYRRAEAKQVSERLAVLDGPMVIAGDLNTPASSSIYRQWWGDYRNAFTEAGWGIGHTVRIIQGGFRFSSRIDHILATEHWRASECWIGPDVGSDHRPVVARLFAR